ncbi:MAG: ATP-binding protein, partial [Ignavibacteriae bacterium]|nr:ATP-binding protein [Ignavibacteriota bacterium]
QNIKTELQLLESSIKTAKNVIRPMLTELKLNIDDIIKIELDEGKLDELLEQQTSTKKTLNQELNREIEGTIKNKADKITQEIFDLNESLSLPEKEYQQYLDDLSDWRVILGSINGNKNVKGTLQYYKYSLAQIMKGKVEKEIQLLTRKRYKIVNKIYSQKLKIIETYKALYKPVENFIVNFNQENPNYKVLFDVNFNSNDLINNFFNYVHQGIAGPFYRIEEGKKRFKELVSSTNFDQRNDSLHFLSKVINLLSEHDIHKQLKKEPLDFYNYLFGLTYLEPTYKLKFGNVELNKLSPGERGALLLIFYLLIDKDDKPLILDQPEENLDNESVYKFLVNFIRLAKSKRQIIIITHNPNLAVVCDAEQVIVANIDKSNLNKVSYTTGSIENPEINTKIIDILEGTLKAFDKRGARYSISRVLQRFGSK